MKTKVLFIVIAITTSCVDKNKTDHFSTKKEINSQQIYKKIDIQNDQSPSDSIKQEFLNTQNNKESPIKSSPGNYLKTNIQIIRTSN